LRTIPGVKHAGATTALPFTGAINNNVILAEGHERKPGESLLAPSNALVSEGYFEAMQIAIVKGRPFGSGDTQGAPLVAIIDERLAERFWPGKDPINRRLYRPNNPNDLDKITPETVFITVIGVARNLVTADPRNDVSPVGTFYFPFGQVPPGGMTFALQLAGPSTTYANDIRRVIQAIDPELPVFRIQTMQETIDRALVGRRAPMLIAAGFSAVALFLAAVGIYGVLAYGVSERGRELGVRMALGGTTGSVFRLVLTDGLIIVGTGLVVGVAGSYFVGRVMQSLLYGVTPMSPMVIGVVTVVLAIVAFVATSIPALRASRIKPSIVLGK
jgi:predicted permease